MSPGESWTIGKNAHVGSNLSNGVHSTFSASELTNKGAVYSTQGYGVLFSGGDSSITNKDSGNITGFLAGIYLGGYNNNLSNYGDISAKGATGDGVFIYDSYGTWIKNYGDIFGIRSGIWIQNTSPVSQGPKIDNHDRIHSSGPAIFFDGYSDEKTTIINRDGARITGDNGAAIYVQDGAITVKNSGVIKGLVQGDVTEEIDDKIVNKGSIKGDVNLWGGDDKVVNKGKIKGDVHLGGGDDTYKSKAGKAKMVFSDYGNDKLIAGDSKDKFVFSSALDSFQNVDTVKKFEPGYDKFYLHTMIFSSLATGPLPASQFHKGKQAADSDDYIIYDKKEGDLYFDRDGSGNLYAQVEFAHVQKNLDLSHHDFTVMA
ncbi:MAG: hypothetical protein KDJ86_13135 [Bauldia sp.]|uniref:polymer-forming cytoskeletal protein n=1 Tax=Bauldia sp. TaxID=2575872 RepID=UPI001DDE74DB|nr:polymer-forming cytoskeletal protein [Bauldia sp.]MCB1496727.1 hypothetical protein [Bauldia sp.]